MTRDQASTVFTFGAVLTVVLAIKSHYSSATAGELTWILAPTAALVGLMRGVPFSFEAGTGWVSHKEMFAIAPECAGINFLLAAFVMLSLTVALRLPTPTAKLAGVVSSFVVAYCAAIVVNATRLVVALALRAHSLELPFMDSGEFHRVQGITVFFTGLFLVYLAARRCLPAGSHEQ